MKKPNSQKRNNSHIYRQVRDIICDDAFTYAVHTANSNASGLASGAFVLHPGPLTSVYYTGTKFAPINVAFPHLPWLQKTSSNFARYRILNAKLVFVGNVGSTASGTIVLAGYTNSIDANSSLQLAFAQGNNVKSFDLARASGKELVVPIPIDSSWKNVSAMLMAPGDTYPFVAPSSAIVPLNTVDSLSFGSVAYTIIGAPASATLGQFFVVYDVEFKDPISVNLNK